MSWQLCLVLIYRLLMELFDLEVLYSTSKRHREKNWHHHNDGDSVIDSVSNT